MTHWMKSTSLIAVMSLLLAGCSGLTISQPDADNLGGERNEKLGKTPGLFVKDTENYDGGFLIASTDPNKKTAFNPGAQARAQQQGNFQTPPSGADFSVAPGEQADFEEFKEFQQFRRFQNAPDSADERQQFRQWQEWENYKRWKQANGAN